MSIKGLSRFAAAACLSLAVFLPRPADAGFDPAIGNYLNPDSVGWGLDVQRIGDIIFVLWFTYRPDGSPVWYLSAAELDGMSWTASVEEYQWTPTAKTATPTTVGNMSLVWTDAENATFSWTLNGVSGGPIPMAFLHFDEGLTTADHTGHYVAPEELGWGASLLTQGDTTAMFLYFYDGNGDAVWMLGVDSTPGMQSDFAMNHLSGPGLCPSCIAGKAPGEVNAKVFPVVTVETRFISVYENFLEDIGVDFRSLRRLGGLTTLPGTTNSNSPLGKDPFGAIDVPEDGGSNNGPYTTLNPLTPSSLILTLEERMFFERRTKMAVDPGIFVHPPFCEGDLDEIHVEIPEQGSTGYSQPEINGEPVNFSLNDMTAPSHVGISKVGDKTVVVSWQASFSDGTIAGFNIMTTVPLPGTVIIGGLESNEVTQTETVPFLHDIPVLGELFKRKAMRNTNTELMIFVCARITDVAEGR